jgi:hypothetical protein
VRERPGSARSAPQRSIGNAGTRPRNTRGPIAQIRACAAWARHDCFACRVHLGRAVATATFEPSAGPGARRVLCHASARKAGPEQTIALMNGVANVPRRASHRGAEQRRARRGSLWRGWVTPVSRCGRGDGRPRRARVRPLRMLSASGQPTIAGPASSEWLLRSSSGNMLSGDHAIANMAKHRAVDGVRRDRRVSKAVVARRWHAEVQSVCPMSPRRTCP